MEGGKHEGAIREEGGEERRFVFEVDKKRNSNENGGGFVCMCVKGRGRLGWPPECNTIFGLLMLIVHVKRTFYDLVLNLSPKLPEHCLNIIQYSVPLKNKNSFQTSS